MMNWTSIESQKGVTVVTAWPVNHLQSAFFLCSFVDASRLGPSLWGASKHSEEMKNRVEVLLLVFGNFAECALLALALLAGTETLTFWWHRHPIKTHKRTHTESCNKINPQNHECTPTSFFWTSTVSVPFIDVSYRDSICFWLQRPIMKCPH